MHVFLQEEIGMDNQIERKYYYKDANYHDSLKLDYYEPNTFNLPDNLSNVYHV